MFHSLTRSQGFPLATALNLQQRCIPASRPSSLTVRIWAKLSLNPSQDGFPGIYARSGLRYCDRITTVEPVEFPSRTQPWVLEMDAAAKSGIFSGASTLAGTKSILPPVLSRSFSSSNGQNCGSERLILRSQKKLPWLSLGRAEQRQRSGKLFANHGRSTWEQSANNLESSASESIWLEPVNEVDNRDIRKGSDASQRQPAKRNGTFAQVSNLHSSKTFENAGGARIDWRFEAERADEEDTKIVHDPRWDKIQNKFQSIEYSKSCSVRPEYRLWNKQQAWGKKMWKENAESSLPKMVGEAVYGVGPVLAALMAGRRELYALYFQEGLNLSGGSRKKKDKKGFEKVLKIAEEIGLCVKEISKHDLNMIVENRPHQGLLLDASSLEMVRMKELEPISSPDDKTSLWLALDEVTDPQNLGAIIRSAYFFGASGVVLCAKNSAPLSGVVSKASAGALEIMELRYCKNMMQFLDASAVNGWRVLGGSVASKAKPLNQFSPGAPTLLVLGSEGTGLRPLVERSCTELVRIPGNIPANLMKNEEREVSIEYLGEEFQSFMAVESLNVSVAAGVFLNHLMGNG